MVLATFSNFMSLQSSGQFPASVSTVFNPAQVTSKHEHFCCPCPKWADFVYSLILELD